jgi:hypothetical protein
MSLIVTHISSYGIIHATDSNLTSADGSFAGEERKLFPVPFLNAALTVAGSYNVGDQPMNVWMDRFIQMRQHTKSLSLEAFARALGNSLQTEMTVEQKASGSLIHIAGYVKDNEAFHPEFWFVRNVYGIDKETGKYDDFRETFQISEDFWTRDWKENKLAQHFEQGGYQIYINGLTSGRVSFWLLQSQMANFFWQVWSNRDWKFRPPKSTEESKLIVDLYIRTIGVLFSLSDYSAPFIGGTSQIHAIPKPKN